jgi:hypothetical protein
LISDITETDYHHEHPEPAGDGEYAFSFTPQRPDTYRVWAELLPMRTHVQQYSVADIPSSTPRHAKLAENEAENRHPEIDGYKFELSFEKDVIHERDTVAGKLRVTEPDGQPCNKLGVVIGPSATSWALAMTSPRSCTCIPSGLSSPIRKRGAALNSLSSFARTKPGFSPFCAGKD